MPSLTHNFCRIGGDSPSLAQRHLFAASLPLVLKLFPRSASWDVAPQPPAALCFFLFLKSRARDESRRYESVRLIGSESDTCPFGSGAIYCANHQTTHFQKTKNKSAGGGVERHPQRRAQSDGQDEPTGMSARARNEAGGRIRAVRQAGAISEGTARTAQARIAKARAFGP